MGLNNDVRHGAREGARFAAVNAGDNDAIEAYVCDAMEQLGGSGLDTIEIGLGQSASPASIGDSGSITILGTVSSLSGLGFIEVFLPSTLSSTIEFRLEQEPSNWGPQAVQDAGC
jgi:hypothetical protein